MISTLGKLKPEDCYAGPPNEILPQKNNKNRHIKKEEKRGKQNRKYKAREMIDLLLGYPLGSKEDLCCSPEPM